MLVLSRRPAEKILFPSLNATVEILSIKPKLVRLGIEAPPAVVVLRGEIRPSPEGPPAHAPAVETDARHPRHLVRERLNSLVVGLALLRRQVQAGLSAGAVATLEKMDGELEALRGQLDSLWEDSTEMRPVSPLTARVRAC
jgi:carbon storage regulator CsrA